MSILPPFPKGQAPQGRFLGLDLHSEEIQCHVLLSDGTALGSVRFVTSASNIELLREELTAQDAVAMEATFNAFTVAQRLLPSGARIVISDPRKTRAIAEAKIKTDKIDARVLAELLRVDYLPKVWLPDPATLELRHLLSDRQSDVTRRTEVKNRIHGVLQRELLKGNRLFTSKDGAQLLELLVSEASPLPPEERTRLGLLRQELAHLDELIAAHEKALAGFITRDAELHARLNRLMTIPGVSLVVGAGLLSAIGDVTQEKQARVKYLATGEKAKGGIKRGEKRSELYGTGLKGKQVSKAIARQAATRTEEKYEALVAARAAGQQTHTAEGQCLIKPDFALDPLRPQTADWEAEIARLHAEVLSRTPKRVPNRT